MNTKRIIFLAALTSLFGMSWPFASTQNTEPFGSSGWLDKETSIIRNQASNIDSTVLRKSLVAYLNAKKRHVVTKDYLTVIDYSKPSNERRMWVIDMRNNKTLYNTYVSHGKNSGDVIAKSFSNSPGSLKSSIGVFATDTPYIGGNGYSLRLRGLERGVNDNAYSRSVVIHGAAYVNPDTIKRYGRAGRSWGCPAVSKELATPLINTIKDSSLVVAYYPDRNWLSHSQFLTG